MTKPHYRRTADGRTIMMSDGYQNLVANLGTSRDKAFSGTYGFLKLTFQECLDAYRASWLPRAIVDIPAHDATRKWRAWQADKQQITAIEATEKRLRVVEKVRDAMKAARLYGGAAILIIDGTQDPTQPLNPATVKKSGIKGLAVLTPLTLAPGLIDWNVYSPNYGKPGSYRLSNSNGEYLEIHPSRLVVFDGVPLPDQTIISNGWGDSVLNATLDTIKQTDSTAANVASLIFEAKIDVLSIQGLADALASGQESAIAKRLAFAMQMKGINGSLILDAGDVDPETGKTVGGETYDQKTQNFGSLAQLMDQFAQFVSGAAGIPMSRLFGRAAAGLNATGEGDERVYFDRINDMQSLEIEPAMSALDECLIRDALGNRPSEIYYDWRPLQQLTPSEKADIFDKVARAARSIAGTTAGELIPIEALSDGLANRLIEDGALPGLDAAIDEYGNLAANHPSEAEMLAAAGVHVRETVKVNGQGSMTETSTNPSGAMSTNDAEPQTLYVRRDVLNADEIIAWAKSQGFKTTLPASDLHVTITFSREPVDWMQMGEAWSAKLEIPAGGARMMEKFGDAQVLLFASSELRWRHEQMVDAGATWDHPEYQPHITISYGADGPDLSQVEPYRGQIVLGPEIFEPVNEDWTEQVKEQQ